MAEREKRVVPSDQASGERCPTCEPFDGCGDPSAHRYHVLGCPPCRDPWHDERKDEMEHKEPYRGRNGVDWDAELEYIKKLDANQASARTAEQLTEEQFASWWKERLSKEKCASRHIYKEDVIDFVAHSRASAVSASPSDERGELIATITYDPINQTSTTTRHVAVSDVSVSAPPSDEIIEREAFEKWANRNGYNVRHCSCNAEASPHYKFGGTEAAWKRWQSSRGGK